MPYEIHRVRIDKGTQKWASGSAHGTYYSLAGIGKLKESLGQDTIDDSDPAIASSSSSFLLYTGYGFREIGVIIPLREPLQTDCVSKYGLIPSGNTEIILSGSDSNGWANWYDIGSIRKAKEIVGIDGIDLSYDVSIQSESLFTLSSSIQWPMDGMVKLYLAV